MIEGISEASHALSIWYTMFFAVLHATSFASAGFRLEPERKKSRVKVTNTKVISTDHAVPTGRISPPLLTSR